MKQEEQNNHYLLLDSRNMPLARGILESPQDAQNWQVLILDNKISEVMKHEEVQMVPMSGNSGALLGRILRNRNDRLVMEKLHALDSEMRQNLRMPAHFRSFIYPITGCWKGRRDVEANDLSCGGIAFFCRDALADGEEVEIVIPITSQPLVLRCKILRRRPSDREEEIMFAAKFVDMCDDEEMLVREAVFNVQLSTRPKASGA